MTDYRKRLEAGLALADHYEMGGVELGEQGVQINFEDLRQLLSEGERMRELVKALIDLDGATPGGLKDSTDNDGGAYQSAHLDVLLDTIARHALGDPDK